MTLLPPNATPAERALEEAMRADIDLSAVGTLWDPANCPAEVLPFLAWGIGISHWDTNWSEAEKREAVAGAIPYLRVAGSRAAVEQVLARFHPLLSLTEGWETTPKRGPRSFEVRAPADIGAEFLTPETAAAIIRDVAIAKPLGTHFDFVQVLEAQAGLYLAAGGMAASMFRAAATTEIDTSRDWSLVLQTEDGEPILTEDGLDYLEDE